MVHHTLILDRKKYGVFVLRMKRCVRLVHSEKDRSVSMFSLLLFLEVMIPNHSSFFSDSQRKNEWFLAHSLDDR